MGSVSWSNGVNACQPLLLAVLLAALPGTPALGADAAAAAPARAWPIPPVRIGGQVSYNARRELETGYHATHKGANGLLNIGTDTHLWEPWFAQLSATVGLSAFAQATSRQGADSVAERDSRSSFLTGDARLKLVPASAFPFELHYQRSDSRNASKLSLDNALRASRIGFTQRLARYGGDAMLAWDRSIQQGIAGTRARQDSAQLNLVQPLGEHVLRLSGTSTRNRRDAEWAHDGNLSLQHDFQRPDSGLSVNSLAHLNRTSFQLGADRSRSHMLQLSSQAMWRPDDSDLAAVAGMRVLGYDGGNETGLSTRVRNANLNGGASYDWTPAIRFEGSANLNYNSAGGASAMNAHQTARATYLPDPLAFGRLRYSWNGAASASNSAGGVTGGRQLTLQAGHHAAHTSQLGRSSISIDGAQSLSWRMSSAKGPGPAQHVNHSASVAWSLLNGNGVATSASVSASDTRELSGSGEFYQLLNVQLSGNLASGAFGALSGDLTLQAVRQSGLIVVGDARDALPRLAQSGDGDITTVTSGALAYSHERWLGVPRLRLTSSLRLNSRALLPVLGREEDQHTAAWETQFDYRIGLITARLAYLVVRTPVLADPRPLGMAQDSAVTPGTRIRRGAQFWLTRSFGQF